MTVHMSVFSLEMSKQFLLFYAEQKFRSRRKLLAVGDIQPGKLGLFIHHLFDSPRP